MTAWILVVGGLCILTLGADFLIRGATTLARRFGLSELLIGLTLVGFGTSTPELVSSIQAALDNEPGIALGNVVGSNIANILLILGASAMIAPVAVNPKAFRRDGLALTLATIQVVAISMTGIFSRPVGVFLIVCVLSYVVVAYITERTPAKTLNPEAIRHESEAAALPEAPGAPVVALGLCMGGLALLVVGAKALITGASDIASELGISTTIIGLTIVAVGTSLPELFTSVAAALKGRSELALGNVIGSNIYNCLGILGVTALTRPINVPVQIAHFDVWIMLAATGALLFFAMTRNKIERWEGALLLTAYAVYSIYLFMRV